MTKYVKYIIMAVVKIIIILQRVVQISNENSETEKGKRAAFHTCTCTHTHANLYAHVHTCAQISL